MEYLSEKAFNMFRDWVKNASEKYPGYVFNVLDESLLVSDLTNTIKTAINCLKKSENINRSIEGYEIGYMLGFIQSNLNVNWGLEYILKQSEIFKNFMALKAISSYLESEPLALIQINEIYKHLVLEDSNIFGPNINIEKQLFGAYKTNLLFKNETANTQIALGNVIKSHLTQFLAEKTGDFLPETENYFTTAEIEKLLTTFA